MQSGSGAIGESIQRDAGGRSRPDRDVDDRPATNVLSGRAARQIAVGRHAIRSRVSRIGGWENERRRYAVHQLHQWANQDHTPEGARSAPNAQRDQSETHQEPNPREQRRKAGSMDRQREGAETDPIRVGARRRRRDDVHEKIPAPRTDGPNVHNRTNADLSPAGGVVGNVGRGHTRSEDPEGDCDRERGARRWLWRRHRPSTAVGWRRCVRTAPAETDIGDSGHHRDAAARRAVVSLASGGRVRTARPAGACGCRIRAL